MSDLVARWGLYNGVNPRDESGTIHVGEVDFDYDPIYAICKTTRAKLHPVAGYAPKKQFCRECLRALRAEETDGGSDG